MWTGRGGLLGSHQGSKTGDVGVGAGREMESAGEGESREGA